MGRKGYKALIVLLSCWLAGCVKDKPPVAAGNVSHGRRAFYIVCEGNFGNGDATLYQYDPTTGMSSGDLYSGANHQPLGDVFQSMAQIGGKLFLCINNSDKVVVTDTGDYKFVASIGIKKPRYILPVSSTRAYVSTLYSNKVYVINPLSYAVTDSIELPNENSEGMCLYNNDVYICAWDTAGKSIFSVDGATNRLVQTINVAGYAPQEVLIDKEQMMWVLSGNQPQGKRAALTRIDPSTGEILMTYLFPVAADALKPVFNSTRDTLYYIEANYYGGTTDNGIYRMGIHDATLPSQPFVAAVQNQYFWALGIDPVTGYIYVGDPKGFTQKGSVYIYKQNGIQTGSFSTGLGPGHFYFPE